MNSFKTTKVLPLDGQDQLVVTTYTPIPDKPFNLQQLWEEFLITGCSWFLWNYVFSEQFSPIWSYVTPLEVPKWLFYIPRYSHCFMLQQKSASLQSSLSLLLSENIIQARNENDAGMMFQNTADVMIMESLAKSFKINKIYP